MATQSKTKSTKEPKLVGLDQLAIQESKDEEVNRKKLEDAKAALRQAAKDLAASKGIDPAVVGPALRICKRDRDWLKRMKDFELSIANADRQLAEFDRSEVGNRVREAKERQEQARLDVAKWQTLSRTLSHVGIGRSQAEASLSREFHQIDGVSDWEPESRVPTRM